MSCPTCDRDLWHVGHVCYTYAELAERRSAAAEARAAASLDQGDVVDDGTNNNPWDEAAAT